MTRPDPTAEPTKADVAFNNAVHANEIYERALKELAQWAVDNAEARFQGQQGGDDPYRQSHIDMAKERGVSSNQWAFELIEEALGEIFQRPRSPEDAADDAYFSGY